MRVNFDDIEIANIDAGGGLVYYFQNQPFTGIIVEYNDKGILIGELTIVNGSKDGRQALYYDNGQIMDEYFESYNRPYGLSRKWDAKGHLIKETDFGAEYKP